ncbi:hypothetical protein BG006_007045 [Podila minutissima]|uniref:Protein kinase domain-containing protein n=1 Tax=Podila minutissima TaxID=64525 RepID=A0A9P5SM45_9FUNG|nr:hypothetical protein BG006_007045 [Podila minutissima]
MVDFGLFSSAIQLANIINEMSRAAQANKGSCQAMNHRIQIANEIIKAAFERHKASPKTITLSESAFKMYFQLLERMRDFVAEISKRKTFSKLFYALRFRDEFDALLRDFDSCVLDLNLGIALRTQSQLETDRNALEDDMVELKQFRKDLQNGLDTLGGQLVGIRQMVASNRPMDDILTHVEIDYRQILEITPGETRNGRTFPVHKRSWLAQEVAEKPLGYFGSKDMLDMLKSEVAILKKLDRCNYITKFMGVTNRNNQISIIMEWLPNGDLASSLARGELEWDQKLFIASDIARGLHFLHEVGIIHKTLRAKNILLTRFNQAKITNFRQSRLESAATRPMSDPFSFVRWLAPEKMTPKEVRYGAECDIYSFGMLLFEIASNRVPFVNHTDRDLPELIVLKDLYETVPEGTPTEYANIMSACWSHDPRLRPTVSQVLLILRDGCIKLRNAPRPPEGLPTSMKNVTPLFNVMPPSSSQSEVYPISPPMTPITQRNGLLTPEVWNNPYVNKRYVEESLEELKRAQQAASQQHPQHSPRPANQVIAPKEEYSEERRLPCTPRPELPEPGVNVVSPQSEVPPLVPKNTRPLGIKAKKLAPSVEERFNNMHIQDGPSSPPPTSSGSWQSPPNSLGSNGARQQQAAIESIRARSASMSPTQQVNNNLPTMAQAMVFHERNERDKAWRIFKGFSDRGNADGMYWTAYYLFHGEGGQPQNKPQAFELFRSVTNMELSPSLRNLSANAHFYTAVCYLEGQGVPRDHVTGFGHMEMAADSGNAFAQYLVGDAYSKGSAVVQANTQKRNHYWQLAARQREARAIEQCRKIDWQILGKLFMGEGGSGPVDPL